MLELIPIGKSLFLHLKTAELLTQKQACRRRYHLRWWAKTIVRRRISGHDGRKTIWCRKSVQKPIFDFMASCSGEFWFYFMASCKTSPTDLLLYCTLYGSIAHPVVLPGIKEKTVDYSKVRTTDNSAGFIYGTVGSRWGSSVQDSSRRSEGCLELGDCNGRKPKGKVRGERIKEWPIEREVRSAESSVNRE